MPSAPKAPDPNATAAAQANANKNAVYDSARVNQIGESTPYGSRTWHGEIGSPDRGYTDTFSPEEQRKYDLLNSVIFGMGDHVQNRLGQITDEPFSLDGLPQRQFGGAVTSLPQTPQGPTKQARDDINNRYSQAFTAAGLPEDQFINTPQFKQFATELNSYYGNITDKNEIQKELAYQSGRVNDPLYGESAKQFVSTLKDRDNQYFGAVAPITMDFDRVGDLQRKLDMSGVTDLAGVDDFSSDRQRVEDALYQRQTSRLDPQFERQRNELETRLANQGITLTSNPAAYQQAMDEFERNKNDAYAMARNDSIAQGGSEQGRIFGQSLAARGQTFGEAATAGGFVNQAQGQQFGQNLTGAEFRNTAQDQAFTQKLNELQFGNTWNRVNQQDTNSARDSMINEILLKRNQPLAELASLMTFNAPQMAQFGGPAQYQMQAPDIGGYITNNFNQQMAGRNALINALGSAAGAAGSAAIMHCWVAREVYGASNPKWLRMREWMLTKAPKALLAFYEKHGPAIAEYIADKPQWRDQIRSAMDDIMVPA